MANDINVNEFKLRDPVRNIPDGLSVKGAESISEGPDPAMPFFVIT